MLSALLFDGLPESKKTLYFRREHGAANTQANAG